MQIGKGTSPRETALIGAVGGNGGVGGTANKRTAGGGRDYEIALGSIVLARDALTHSYL